MTISIWRYSHLTLAVSSFLFIALASITGIVLAFEPVLQKTQPYREGDFNQITVAEMIPVLKKEYAEITDVTIDANQFVIAKVIDDNGNDTTIYVNPKTGKSLGTVPKENAFFQWVTTLHRSLFLHETGRIFIGITAFLLFLIATSGTVLVIQRQRGIKRFFQRIIKENFAQYYHVVLGRLTLIPILIITITGTYLSLVRFELVPSDTKITHKIDFDAIRSEPAGKPADFKVFKNMPLSEVQSIEFPFSEDVEDYYTFKLKDKELVVNQITGDILSEISYSKATIFSNLSLTLHTGRSSAVWAVILAIAAANILFFIYSGFVITLKRRGNRIRNKFKGDESRFIILVGSENGTTFRFANALQQQLLKQGEKSYITEMNNYTVFPNAEQLILITATYGLGDAPTNASKFLSLLEKFPQQQNVQFSVLGFGSRSYPDFCKFAYDINNTLNLQTWAQPLLDIHTVNDKSPDDFQRWMNLWSQTTAIPFSEPIPDFKLKPKQLQSFTVVSKTELAHTDGAFLIQLKPNKKQRFRSGDLLAIYPANDHRERLYSVGKVNHNLQLSVKLHTDGLGSSFLYHLKVGETFKGRISKNEHFHFPEKARKVIMISNGTGIAPFLGMLDENKNADCYLYCGFRGEASFALYNESIDGYLSKLQLKEVHIAYSREGEKQYVKDLLARDSEFIAATLKSGGVIMICGSLAMQQNVTALLEVICSEQNNVELGYYQSHDQILTDCY
ncbi:PepSY domain-containing protein [Flavobacterium cerinum]|uniref:NADPH--hemoprotein reductase n=1 Tax=Flavobacterium cerinum TaxID=2502784 RepID=A0ABY5IM65_9FLAO|nr:PepSY domain-containing protein [Flavobacterium cerinum]UUC43902.1 PepSY domain-containing protein [Flavobacterium cerinum]